LQCGGSRGYGIHWPWPTSRNIQRSRKIRVRNHSSSLPPRSSTPSSSPHILAPTASDLVKYNKKDTILAGFHTDLNFLTIHGRSRYPGLHIWARNTGKRIPVRFPSTGRYLLVQAGKQLEHLSGGLVKAGYHEVVVSEATLQVRVPFSEKVHIDILCSLDLRRRSRSVK
jgi:isopenicillin N synthase-like dioxygenase